ncbi:MAG: RHS repeat-associated core domain-containing protein [Opitutaceae bacterium]|nr:RHS repeat-associated core domain-containing protein [Cytophagales bacterium]
MPTATTAPAEGATLYDEYNTGSRTYEMSNHLGNVLATISDKKLQHINAGNAVDYYLADVVNQRDYYPFGMLQPGRSYGAGYRYGFNGKEQDKETTSTTTYDYGFRIYNPALGKFLSVDPLIKKYPELTPYQFASNTPIQAVDLDGAESMFGWSIGLTPEHTAATADSWNKSQAKIFNGSASGIKKSLKKGWNSLMHPIQAIKNMGSLIEEAALDLSTVKVAPSPNIDAKAQDI